MSAPTSLFRKSCAAKASPAPKARGVVHESKSSKGYLQRLESSKDPEDIAKVVDRNIQRFLGKAVPAAAIDVVSIVGKNMRERMIADRMDLLARGRCRADPAYFGDIKKQYMAALLGTSTVAPTSASGEVPEGLQTAMFQARHTQRRNRKREPLVHYLWQCRGQLNQRSVIELVDLLVETQELNCLRQAMLVQEVFATFARLDMLAKFAKEVAPVKPILEHSLIMIYTMEHKSQKDYGFDTFWQKYKQTASIFLTVPFVEKVLQETESWSKCIPELSALDTGSKLGTELFMPYCTEVIGAHIDDFMRQTAAEMKGQLSIEPVLVNGLVAKMMAEADRLKVDRLLPARDCSFDFMGYSVSLRMTTAVEQARHHIVATIKTIAVDCGMLAQLSVEAEVDPKKPAEHPLEKVTIGADLLSPFQITRALMDSEAQRASLPTPASWGAFFESKRAIWFLQDPTFELEVQRTWPASGVASCWCDRRSSTSRARPNTTSPLLWWRRTSANWRLARPGCSPPRQLGASCRPSSRSWWPRRGARAHWRPSSRPARTLRQWVSDWLSSAAIRPGAPTSATDAGRVFGHPAAAKHLELLEKHISEKSLSDLSPVTNLEVFRWLLSAPEAEKLTNLGEQAYDLASKRVPGKQAANLSDAMDVVVAAASSAKAAKASKKEAGPKIKAEAGAASKKRKSVA